MLLRASGEYTGATYDLRSVNGDAVQMSGIQHAGLLVDFAEAVIGDAGARLARVRHRIVSTLGNAALVDIAAVVAIFNSVVRIADATGIPLEDYKVPLTADLRASLGIDAYRSAEE